VVGPSEPGNEPSPYLVLYVNAPTYYKSDETNITCYEKRKTLFE
jgi:hypothetical protein